MINNRFLSNKNRHADAGFTLDWVQVVDQFRWSTHIELVAQFTRPPQPDPRGRRR